MKERRDLESVRFPFRLGEKTLFALSLPMLVVKSDFLGERVSRDQYLAELAHLPAAHGVLYRSIESSDEGVRLSTHGSLLRYVPQRFPRYYTPLNGTFDEYQSKFSSKTRSGLRRKLKKLSDCFDGNLSMKSYADPDLMPEFHRMARAVSGSTYQERLFDAGLPASDEFREKMVRAASRKEAVGFLLFGGGRPIAYIYCPQQGSRLVYQYVGYDTGFSRFSPGTVLQWLAFDYLFENCGGLVFDFTEGEGSHKKFFATRHVDCANVYYLRRSLRVWTTCLLHELSEHGNRLFGLVLERLGLKATVKRIVRA